jgi:hypothetical protein
MTEGGQMMVAVSRANLVFALPHKVFCKSPTPCALLEVHP